MTALEIAILVFLFTSCGALLGIVLSVKLPARHRDDASRGTIQLVMGLIASVAALVLGLLISSAHTLYDAQEAEVRQLGIHLFELDRILADIGPQAADARSLLRRIVVADMTRIWPSQGGSQTAYEPLQAQSEAKELIDRIANLSPQTPGQRFNQNRALQLSASLGDSRFRIGEEARGSLSWPFLVVLVFWLAILFVGFGLFARLNATVITALLVGALSVAGALFLILEMNRPYSGLMRISDVPIRDALKQMGP
jgi:Protein of unknown function (DUF4239)